MEYKDIKSKLEAKCKDNLVSEYRVYHSLDNVYIHIKEKTLETKVIVLFIDYLKIVDINKNEIELIKYKDIINIYWGRLKMENKKVRVIRDWEKLKDEMHKDFSSKYRVLKIFVIENTIEIDISKKILVPKDFIFIRKMLKKYKLNLLNVSTYRRNFCFSFY